MSAKIYMSNCYGEVEVIEQKGKDCIVRFKNTGFERHANIDNVRAGKVKDLSVEYVQPTTYPNKIFTSNKSGDLIVLEKTGKNCIVQFLATGYTKVANFDNVCAGKVSDPYYPNSYGIGYLGEPKSRKYKNQAYQLWRNMLKRCYSKNDPRGYYGKGVTVDKAWLCFATFLEDVKDLENFDQWLLGHIEGNTKYNLDKDKKYPGNKVYSKQTCMFLREFENKSMGSKNRHNKMGEN